jgi:chemotaxis protein histidine kinase CheA
MKHTAKRQPRKPTGDELLIARAEAALESLSTHFAGWMEDECCRLEAVNRRIQDGARDAETLDALYRAAHDLKGEAATFGYAGVAGSAAALCDLVESLRQRGSAPAQAIAPFVADIRAAVNAQHRK